MCSVERLHKYWLIFQASTDTILLDEKEGPSLPVSVQWFQGLLLEWNLQGEWHYPLLAPRRTTRKCRYSTWLYMDESKMVPQEMVTLTGKPRLLPSYTFVLILGWGPPREPQRPWSRAPKPLAVTEMTTHSLKSGYQGWTSRFQIALAPWETWQQRLLLCRLHSRSLCLSLWYFPCFHLNPIFFSFFKFSLFRQKNWFCLFLVSRGSRHSWGSFKAGHRSL